MSSAIDAPEIMLSSLHRQPLILGRQQVFTGAWKSLQTGRDLLQGRDSVSRRCQSARRVTHLSNQLAVGNDITRRRQSAAQRLRQRLYLHIKMV